MASGSVVPGMRSPIMPSHSIHIAMRPKKIRITVRRRGRWNHVGAADDRWKNSPGRRALSDPRAHRADREPAGSPTYRRRAADDGTGAGRPVRSGYRIYARQELSGDGAATSGGRSGAALARQHRRRTAAASAPSSLHVTHARRLAGGVGGLAVVDARRIAQRGSLDGPRSARRMTRADTPLRGRSIQEHRAGSDSSTRRRHRSGCRIDDARRNIEFPLGCVGRGPPTGTQHPPKHTPHTPSDLRQHTKLHPSSYHSTHHHSSIQPSTPATVASNPATRSRCDQLNAPLPKLATQHHPLSPFALNAPSRASQHPYKYALPTTPRPLPAPRAQLSVDHAHQQHRATAHAQPAHLRATSPPHSPNHPRHTHTLISPSAHY